jgi:glycosyltransferase involved in cell wall biosynthesis
VRIGLLIWGSLERLTGGFLYDRMLAEHLRRQGHEVSVVAVPMRSYWRALLDNLSPRLLARLREPGFDLLLQDELAHPSCVLLNRRLRRSTAMPIVPIVHLLRVSQRWPWWQRPLYRRVERSYLASVHGLILVNPQLRDRIAGLTGAELPSVVARPAGDHAAGTISAERIQARAREDPFRILFIGNLTPLKNLHLVLDALARVSAGGTDGWRLDVIGNLEVDPGYTRRIRRRIARAGLGERVRLRGEQPRAEVAARLERGHVLAMPSAPESYSIVYLEAMSWGLPVIASTMSDSSAMIEPGKNGFLVAGDAEALAGHLRGLMTDRERLARMGLAARRFYAAQPTWEESMEEVHQFLLRLYAAKPSDQSR